ncbi:MAG TPA: hypothetical protein VD834_16625 [Blastococcus sp.]|nr:hypothetical protein [Blastococcus sp.]
MSQYPPLYPPWYPTADPIPAVTERLLVNGVDLGSYAFMTSDISGLLSVPARRGEDVVVAGRHGRIRIPRKRYDAGEIVLPMWVVGCYPDGTVPSGSGGMAREFWNNRDELLRLFHGDDVELEFTRADGVTSTTTVEVVDVMDFTRRYAEPMAQVSVALRLADPFWSEAVDVSQTITGTTGTTATLTAFVGSTAPIADARITFFGSVSNPRLTIGDRWVEYRGVIGSGRQLVLECEHWRASAGTGAAWSPSPLQVYREPGPAWLEIPPSAVPLTVTFAHTGGGSASVEIAGRRKYLSP